MKQVVPLAAAAVLVATWAFAQGLRVPATERGISGLPGDHAVISRQQAAPGKVVIHTDPGRDIRRNAPPTYQRDQRPLTLRPGYGCPGSVVAPCGWAPGPCGEDYAAD